VIDARAVVHPAARIAADATIGPFSVIGADVEIGAGCAIGPHVVIRGPTRIGRGNRVFQFASVGEDSADRKYAGEPTRLEIGDHNVIREGVTIHRGTVQDRGVTTIGNHNLLMAGVHVAHDSLVGDHVVLVNNAAIAGHVTVGDWAVLGGYVLVQQRARIGAHSFAAMGSVIRKDVPAFVRVAGHPARVRGLNREGLRRRGFGPEAMRALALAYRTLYRSGLTTGAALDALEPLVARHAEVRLFADSVRGATVGIVR
jgi:UDP-N-acetylglucosamine acyltransferase